MIKDVLIVVLASAFFFLGIVLLELSGYLSKDSQTGVEISTESVPIPPIAEQYDWNAKSAPAGELSKYLFTDPIILRSDGVACAVIVQQGTGKFSADCWPEESGIVEEKEGKP